MPSIKCFCVFCNFGVQLLVKDLFDVNYGMFTYNENTRLFWFNPASCDTLAEYRLIGKTRYWEYLFLGYVLHCFKSLDTQELYLV